MERGVSEVLPPGQKVLAILKDGRKMFPPFTRRGHERFYPVWRGRAQKVLDPHFSHFVAPHPEINDQSLTEYGGLIIFSLTSIILLAISPYIFYGYIAYIGLYDMVPWDNVWTM